jgi:plastocyanin
VTGAISRLAAACVCLAVLAACAPAAPPAKAEEIVIDQLAFGKAPTDLRVGDTVKWVNHDMFEHSATATDGQFDVDLPPGATGQALLTRPGTITYTCKFHPGMTGRFSVAPLASRPA